MIKRHQDKAAQIVEAFSNTLDIEALQQISDAQLKGLQAMIVEAMGEELGIAAARVAAVVTELRAESERPDLEL
jgi:hypothetical protein